MAVKDHLLKEKADVEARMALLREELELIEKHVRRGLGTDLLGLSRA